MKYLSIKPFVGVLVLIFIQSSFSYGNFTSALVPRGHTPQSWMAYVKSDFNRRSSQKLDLPGAQVLNTAQTYSLSSLPGAETILDIDSKQLLSSFKLIRDTRFLTEPTNPQFLRRISWLYPQDGCFARASMARELILKSNGPLFKKIFVLGELAFSWWYHVALVAKSQGQLYVLDPALSSDGPMLLDDWMKATHNAESDRFKSQVAICSPYTYEPTDNCQKTTTMDLERVSTLYAHQYLFLKKEWAYVKRAGYDPYKVLGEEPPWYSLLVTSGVSSGVRAVSN